MKIKKFEHFVCSSSDNKKIRYPHENLKKSIKTWISVAKSA